MQRFSGILVANRGEIACRIMRTANAMGYHTVAVYTDVDALAPHVQMADEAVRIGAGPVADSYLSGDKIIAAAKESAVGAIHPGYGFLSENAAFAAACADAGLTFIGPSAEAIRLMGNKADAKRCMREAGVPCVPGYDGEDQDDGVLAAEAEKIGPPVMVKAAAGGGGRGMRLVRQRHELPNALKLARSEAEQAFGSGELIIEKAILRPRHVEIQIFADAQGNTINLGERDCSVQRRHQKVIEEAPCPVMTPELRARMGDAAVAAAKSIGYYGAGTVEFLLDEDGKFYFLEMNTRLQVEHPVTELVTSLDLVALQIRVAQGESLGLGQQDIELSGHAIEARLYAEDPAQDFLPTSGPVVLWEPAVGDGIRVDSGIESGQEISPFYDPMVAKIIAHGPDREAARMRLLGALHDLALFGVRNNKRFLAACLEKETFIAGQATTAFIADEFDDADFADTSPTAADAAVAAVLDIEQEYQRMSAMAVLTSPELKNWASGAELTSHRRYRFGETLYELEIRPPSTGGGARYRVSGTIDAIDVELLQLEERVAHVAVNGSQTVARFLCPEAGKLYLMIEGRTALFDDQIRLSAAAHAAEAGGRVIAPMHGQVLEVRIGPGEDVFKGQKLAVLEAMKMQHEVLAPADGRVVNVLMKAGQQVAADDVLVEIEAPASTEGE